MTKTPKPETETWTKEVYRDLLGLPKVDLHRHMEGSLRLETLAEVAREHGVDLPSYEIEELRPYVQVTDDVPDFHNFLGKMELLRHFYSAGEAVERIAYEAVADAAHDNIHYLELRISPAGKRISPEEVMANVTDGVLRATHDFAIQVSLIVTVIREFGIRVAEDVLDLALDFRERGVVALDLAGHEGTHSGAPFAQVFRRAQENGLHATIHAGEAGGAEHVREAIELLKAERIGHGVRAIEDHAVVGLLTEQGITLEVCPTSNLQTGVTPTFSLHPLRELFDAGVPVTVNTDDPSISDTTLTDEYMVAVTTMGFSVIEIQRMILNAVQAAFLPQTEKLALLERFEKRLGLLQAY
jgi:adenosine deaminase